MQREFWNDIGRTSDDGEISPRFLPTPTSAITAGYAKAENIKTLKEKKGGHSGNELLRRVRENRGMSILSAVVSPARTSAMPEREQDSVENAQDSSTRQPVSFARWDQDTFFSKMSQLLSAVRLATDTCQIDAYAAGLIDGEGCIYASKYKNKSGNTYAARIDVGMSIKSLEVLQWLASVYGGTIQRSRKASERWAEARCWVLCGKQAEACLMRLLPYLKLKQEQAKLAVSVQHLAKDGWTKENRERGRKIWESLRVLNQKGPTTSSETCSLARLAEGTWVTEQRTLFDSLGLERWQGRWPRSGTMRSGTAYRLPPLVRRISGTGYSYWRTPNATDADHGGPNARDSSGNPHLSMQAAMWPTPRGSESFQGMEAAEAYAAAGHKQPRTRAGKTREHSTFDTTLTTAVMAELTWPTPAGRDWRHPNKKPFSERGGGTKGEQLPNAVGGALNPTWVEWLMGFPLGWTDLGASETPSSRKSRSGSATK